MAQHLNVDVAAPDRRGHPGGVPPGRERFNRTGVGVRGHLDQEDHHDAVAERDGIDVAQDLKHAIVAQPLDPGADCRLRDTELSGDISKGTTSVSLELLKDLSVDIVESD